MSDADEIARLRAELATAHDEIDALRAQLAAFEATRTTGGPPPRYVYLRPIETRTAPLLQGEDEPP